MSGGLKLSAPLVVCLSLWAFSSRAEESPLLGTWLHVDYDNQGKATSLMYVGFDRQGNYTIWLPFPATPDGLVTYSGHYKLLGDGRYEAEIESFSPAQYCVGSICTPTPVQEPIGTAFTCSYQPNPPLLMSIDCGLGPQRYDLYKPLPQ